MIPVEYVLPCLASSIAGFLCAVVVLDRFYRDVLRQAIGEIHRQYRRHIK